MKEWEAIMIGPNGEHMVVSAWGETLEEATQKAGQTVKEDFPGWTVTLTGEVRKDV